MNNIKNIYQHAGKCDDQQNLKDIIEAALLSTLEVFIYNSPNVHMTSTPVNKPRFSVLGLTSNMFVNNHSDFLALGLLTGVDGIRTLGMLSGSELCTF